MPVNSSYRYFSHLFAEIANAVVVFLSLLFIILLPSKLSLLSKNVV